MVDARKYTGGWLKASDLDGPKTVTIAEVGEHTFDRGPQPTLTFENTAKRFGLSANCNIKTIIGLLGHQTDGWVGRQIVLYPTTCDYKGEQVPCIRVRGMVTVAPAETVPPGWSASREAELRAEGTASDAEIPF